MQETPKDLKFVSIANKPGIILEIVFIKSI